MDLQAIQDFVMKLAYALLGKATVTSAPPVTPPVDAQTVTNPVTFLGK